MIELSGAAQRLTIFIGEADIVDHKPLATEIVHRAHAAGLAGVTVLRGEAGYGASNHIHTTRILSLSEDLPVVIVIVDEAERIESFLPVIEQLVVKGLVIIDDVRVISYGGRPAATGPTT